MVSQRISAQMGRDNTAQQHDDLHSRVISAILTGSTRYRARDLICSKAARLDCGGSHGRGI